MPQISNKGLELPQSAIRKLVPFADAAKERGIHVYHLNIGQPDIETPSGALKALADTANKMAESHGVLEYSHSAGIQTYRRALCNYYHRHGIDVTPNQVIVTTGGSEALQMAFTVCLNPGDEIIIPEPYYTNYNTFAKLCDAKIVTIPSDIKTGFALPPIEDFEKAITPRTKAIMICNPNNPTGYLYTHEELLKVAGLVKKYDLYLFADEVYREFCYDGHKHFSVMQLQGLERNVILFDSVSKRYSACGARVGCMVTVTVRSTPSPCVWPRPVFHHRASVRFLPRLLSTHLRNTSITSITSTLPVVTSSLKASTRFRAASARCLRVHSTP